MNTSKTLALTLSALVAVSVMLLLIQSLTRKLKITAIHDGRFRNAFGVWFSLLLTGATFNIYGMMNILTESIDSIYKSNPVHVTAEVVKTASLFIGFSAGWFLGWYFVSGVLSTTILGKRKDAVEMELNNISFFLIKGIIMVVLILCLSPAFEDLLRIFMPELTAPFYH